jgi:hypothetical protein
VFRRTAMQVLGYTRMVALTNIFVSARSVPYSRRNPKDCVLIRSAAHELPLGAVPKNALGLCDLVRSRSASSHDVHSNTSVSHHFATQILSKKSYTYRITSISDLGDGSNDAMWWQNETQGQDQFCKTAKQYPRALP